MRSTALAWTHRRPAGWRSLHRGPRTRTLENRLTALRHASTGRRTGTRRSCWPGSDRRRWRRGVNRTRTGLRNDEAALWPANRLTRTHRRRRGRPRRNLIGRHHGSGTHCRRRNASRGWWYRRSRRRRCNRCGWRCCLRWRRSFRRWRLRNVSFRRGDLVFNHRLRGFRRCSGLNRSSGRRRFGRNDDRRRWTSDRLRRNESGRGLRLSRSNGRSGTRRWRCWRRGLGGNSGGRSHGLARRCNRGGWPMRRLLLGLLTDRLQHIARFGDV